MLKVSLRHTSLQCPTEHCEVEALEVETLGDRPLYVLAQEGHTGRGICAIRKRSHLSR